jgi:two-component system, NarL family, nitrate/nitrite response regulator NarL
VRILVRGQWICQCSAGSASRKLQQFPRVDPFAVAEFGAFLLKQGRRLGLLRFPTDFASIRLIHMIARNSGSGMVDRTIIADDHPLFREGLRRIIQRIVPGKIVEVADTKTLMIEARKDPPPTMMLLDLVFPGFTGAGTISELRNTYPQTALIVVSMTDEQQVAKNVMAAGANGFISKSVSADHMIEAIRQIQDGELVVCLDDSNSNSPPHSPSVMDKLPQRHIDVLIRLGQGMTNKEIARDLNISPFTVRAHISALFKTLDVSTRAAASAMAALYGLV